MVENVCSFCGAAVLPGSIFCDQCGTDLRQIPTAAPPQPGASSSQTVVGMDVLSELDPKELNSQELLPAFKIPSVTAPPLHTLTGRLVLQGSNVSLELPKTHSEALVGREDPAGGFFPQINLEPHGAQENGVSRRHLRIFVSVGKIFVEDLHSVNGTYLNRSKLEPGAPAPLQAGDEIKLGKLTMVYLAD